jgi:hypothetical protein
MERVRWDAVPAWLDVPAKNPLVVGGKDDDVAGKRSRRYDFSSFGKALA